MLDHLKNREEASCLLTEIATEWCQQRSLAFARLSYTKRAIQGARDTIIKEDEVSLLRQMVCSSNASIFEGANFRVSDGSYKAVALENSVNQLNGVLSFVGSMSLIYAHSCLEDMLMRCLRLLKLHAPDLFEDWIAKKQVSFSEAKNGLAPLAEAKLETLFDELSRDGLLKKIMLFDALIATSHKTSVVKDYVYNHDKLEKLDQLRHDFAHRRLSDCDEVEAVSDVEYLFDSGMHFLAQMTEKFGLQGAWRDSGLN